MKLRTVFFIILIIILGLFVFTGCENKETYDGDIITFEYSYGGYPDGLREYQIYTKDEKTYIKARGSNGVELNLDKEIDNSTLKALANIIKENSIIEWNGFKKKDNISDGYGFSLKIKYNDGKEITASGHEKYPKKYDIGHDALSSYLEAIK